MGAKSVRIAAAVFAIFATATFADDLTIPSGTAPDGTQLGHIFLNGCAPTVPALMEDRAELFRTAYGWTKQETEADAAYSVSDGAISVAIDGNPLRATCEMTTAAEIVDDGYALYVSLEEHLAELVDPLPTGEAIDGGIAWSWSGPNSSFLLEYIEGAEAFTIRLTSEG